MFSTSDNSNPNENNRVYEVRLLPGIVGVFPVSSGDESNLRKIQQPLTKNLFSKVSKMLTG